MLLEYLPVKEIAISAYAPDEEEMLSTILQSAEAHNVKISYIGREAEALLGDISIRMFTPLSDEDANDQCVISIVSIGDYDMLVTGDASKEAEETLLQNQSLPAIDLYVAGHHGSKTSTGTDLLETLRQALADREFGKLNRFFGQYIDKQMSRRLIGREDYKGANRFLTTLL